MFVKIWWRNESVMLLLHESVVPTSKDFIAAARDCHLITLRRLTSSTLSENGLGHTLLVLPSFHSLSRSRNGDSNGCCFIWVFINWVTVSLSYCSSLRVACSYVHSCFTVRPSDHRVPCRCVQCCHFSFFKARSGLFLSISAYFFQGRFWFILVYYLACFRTLLVGVKFSLLCRLLI